MRRHASEWAVGHAASKAISIPGAQGIGLPEGDGGLCAMGEQGAAPGGVFDHGTLEEDSPETWEALTSPRDLLALVSRRHNHLRAACQRDAHAAGRRVRHRISARDEVGRRRGTTGAEADGNEGVGGLHTSFDVGERDGARTRPSKGGPC